MAADQFVADGCVIVEIEAAVFFTDPGVQHHLQQQIAQFLFQMPVVAMANCICHLMGFLQHVGHQRGMGLLQVPGTSVLWIPQVCHHAFEAA